MKVVVIPPGSETRWPWIIRLTLLLPMAKYKRWRIRAKMIRLLKPALIRFNNLPKKMPTDFEFIFDTRVMRDSHKTKTQITFGKNLVIKKNLDDNNLDRVQEIANPFSTVQKQKLYDSIRSLGFIHFETSDNEDVSFDYVTQTDYTLKCGGREFTYSNSTTEPNTLEWGAEESELNRLLIEMVRDSTST